MKRNSIIFFITIVSIFFIILGIATGIDYLKNNNKIQKEDDYDQLIREVSGIEFNESEELVKKHCIENICLENLKIHGEPAYDMYSTIAKIENTSTKKIIDKYYNIVFDLGERKEKAWIYIEELKAKEENDVVAFADENIFKKAKSYKIEPSTKEEIEEYKLLQLEN